MNRTFETLGFTDIIRQLKERANSEAARELLGQLSPYMGESELRKNMKDTTQARQMLDALGQPPLPSMDHVEEYLDQTVKGDLLLPEEIEQIGTFLAAVTRMKAYLERGRGFQISLAFYDENLTPMEELREEIAQSIRSGMVDDHASNELRNIRRDMGALEDKIKQKAETLLRSGKSFMAENFVVQRSGRTCLPVKREHRGKVPGSVVDQSATGATVFIEPAALAGLREEIELRRIEEDCEVRRILYELCDRIALQEPSFRENLKMLVKLDYIFAKGKLSADLKAVEPAINTEGNIRLVKARHPMLPAENCVPLDFKLGGGQRGVVITGPNTGGKTVAIKTVGLLSLMGTSGLHVPCEEADICMANQVLCDIGDGQNIEDNLSTFSAHIGNVLEILKRVTRESIVILDELGSGTDPAEGMGIAVSILEQLRTCGCLFLVTTHYPEVKTYAAKYEEILNARMAFDRENLKPLYRLEIGKAGESCALYIAKRLGMPDDMIRMAAKTAYGALKPGMEQELHLGRDGVEHIRKQQAPKLVKQQARQAREMKLPSFSRGDSVLVQPDQTIGIVVKPDDENGNVLVQVKKEKVLISHKRLKLKVAASQLYPEDYDFSIIFDSVENRKARHDMDRKFVKGLEIQVEE